MSLVSPIISLMALVATIICCTKAIWHAFGMMRGVRASSEWWVNLIPFAALALPGALDSQGQAHRTKFVIWAFVTLVFAATAFTVQFIFHP